MLQSGSQIVFQLWNLRDWTGVGRSDSRQGLNLSLFIIHTSTSFHVYNQAQDNERLRLQSVQKGMLLS